LSLQVNQCLFGVVELLRDLDLHLAVIFAHLSQFNLTIDFLLLQLVLELVLSLLGLVKGNLLLKLVVLHLLVLQEQCLDLTVQLLEYKFVLLDHHLQILLAVLLLLKLLQDLLMLLHHRSIELLSTETALQHLAIAVV